MPGLDLGHAAQYESIANLRSGSQRVNAHQFWAVGCSVTVGVGVEPDQTWKAHVSEHLNLPYTDLCAEGSSILWQSDQICQSPIHTGDFVLWALTTQPRLPVIRDGKLMHLTPGEYAHCSDINQEFPIDLLLHPSIVYHNIQAVRRANFYCQAMGAHLLVQSVIYDIAQAHDLYQIPRFNQTSRGPDTWVDYGMDQLHPGPKQHKLFADQFIIMIKSI